jgi:GAF domain-containing protein
MSTHAADDLRQCLADLTAAVGAAFGLVVGVDADGTMLRPAAQAQWPIAHRGWLSSMRIRVGEGPSGQAVASDAMVTVEDVETDPAVADWRPVASELGFRATVALPLRTAGEPIGAVAVYFREPTALTAAQHRLLQAAADRLAGDLARCRFG